jgi:hypothetical protein
MNNQTQLARLESDAQHLEALIARPSIVTAANSVRLRLVSENTH